MWKARIFVNVSMMMMMMMDRLMQYLEVWCGGRSPTKILDVVADEAKEVQMTMAMTSSRVQASRVK